MPKVPARKEPFVLKALEGLFAKAPFALAKLILSRWARIKNRTLRWTVLVVLLLVPILMACRAMLIARFIHSGFETSHLGPGWKIGLELTVFYLAFLVILTPLFLLIARYGNDRKDSLSNPVEVRREKAPLTIRKNRLASTYDKAYLGHSFVTGKPIYLTNDQRLMHAEVIGSTGTGKTDSVLVPLLAHDLAIRKNQPKKGAIIIDGKGDRELFNHIYYLVKENNRREDFMYFSLAEPEQSNTYNPLLHGNATELKDKIVGSMPWSDEFYRKMAEQATLAVLQGLLKKYNIKPTKDKTGPSKALQFRDLHDHLTQQHTLKALHDSISGDLELRQDIRLMLRHFRDNPKFISGLMADLYLTARSEFSWLVDVDDPDINLIHAYRNNQIVYFQLNLQGFGDTAKRFGRIILQDLRTVSSYIQSQLPESQRHFFPIFIDDAATFLDINFIDFLNKARASKFAITLLHQSPGDLVFHRAPSFGQQVVENTNIKIILRQDHPDSVEKMTKIGGTRKALISTYQTEENLLGKGLTGVGSIREGQEFRIEPDLIRALQLGQAAVIWKSPSMHTDFVKLDYIGHHEFYDDYKPIRKHPVSPEAHKRTFNDADALGKIRAVKEPKKDEKNAA